MLCRATAGALIQGQSSSGYLLHFLGLLYGTSIQIIPSNLGNLPKALVRGETGAQWLGEIHTPVLYSVSCKLWKTERHTPVRSAQPLVSAEVLAATER